MHSAPIETSAVLLGSNAQLFAMRTGPVGSSPETGVVIFSAGMLHSIGPFGLHVDLANELGKMGCEVLRLDQSGKGESPSRTGLDGAAAALRDYDDAFAHLANRGVASTILIGLCSGAADAILIASERSSVAGLVLIDGYAYRTMNAVFRHYAGRIVSPASWFHASKRITEKLIFAQTAEAQLNLSDVGEWMDHADIRRRYLDVLRKNTKMLAVFSGGQTNYNHVGQLADYLSNSNDLENLQEVFFEDSDHTYTITQHRHRLVDTIKNWMESKFAPALHARS